MGDYKVVRGEEVERELRTLYGDQFYFEKLNHTKAVAIRKGACKDDSCPAGVCRKWTDQTWHYCMCIAGARVHFLHQNETACSERNIVTGGGTAIKGIPLSISSTSSIPHQTEPQSLSQISIFFGGWVPLVIFGGIILFVIFAIGIFFASRYSSHNKKKTRNFPEATPVSLSKGLLDADCYTNNPQYFKSSPDSYCSSLCVPEIDRDRVKFIQGIGEGCFGKVWKAEISLENNEVETVAIKVLKDTREAEEDFIREVEIMSSFHHTNILSLLGIAKRETGKSPWMVFEFMVHGDLTEVLRRNSGLFYPTEKKVPILDEEALLSIAFQIACGMEYLADQHFVHRDLACRNCLVGTNLTVKIADFGMSRDVYTCDYYKVGGSRLLPIRWMSPESVTYGRFTLESDVWSYGVVLWEIYSLGKQPYFGLANEEVLKQIVQGILLIPPERCPSSICEIMKACWKTEPRNRTNFKKIHNELLRISTNSTLPRPPPFPIGLRDDYESEDDYLTPNPTRPPHEYLETIP